MLLDSYRFSAGDLTSLISSFSSGQIAIFESEKVIRNSTLTLPGSAIVGINDGQTLNNKRYVITGSTNWNAEAPLSVRSNGLNDATGGAFMTFNRVGYYSTNFGLDNSNNLVWKGLSLGGSIPWSVSGAGIMRVGAGVYFGAAYNVTISSSSATLYFTSGSKAHMTLNATCTISSMSFPGIGSYLILVTQNSTGGYTLSWPSGTNYIGSATAPQINTAANGRTLISIYYNGSSIFLGGAKINA